MNNNKPTIIVTIIFLAIQCFILAAYIKKHEYKFLAGLIAFTLFFLIFIFIKIRFNIYMNIYITFFLILTLLGYNLFGEYIGLFYKSRIYDKVLHVLGTYAFSLFTYSIISHFYPSNSKNKIREFIYIVAIGGSLGMIFELLEYVADIIMKPDIPNQSDLVDTNIDMIGNLVGAVLAALHVHVTNFWIVRTSE